VVRAIPTAMKTPKQATLFINLNYALSHL